MPPIPVHIDDPITPQKPTGVTPQTAQGDPPQQNQSPAQVPATTTAAASTQSSYPAAAPGQAAVPAPTPYVANPPPQPTRTTDVAQDGPPPPQPGAVPVPPSQNVASSLPPPPKPGEAAKARGATQMPPQMGIPAPTTNYTPTHSTSTIPPPIAGGATTVNLGPVTGSPSAPAGVPTAPHQRPEGYRQDLNAQEMSAAQRSSLEEQERRESVFAGVNAGSGGEGMGETAAGAWSAVKGFMNTAGEKLAGAEEEVWKRINGGK